MTAVEVGRRGRSSIGDPLIKWPWQCTLEGDREGTSPVSAHQPCSPKVALLAAELFCSLRVATRILSYAASGWKGFFTLEHGIVRQTHHIRGLKVYYLPGTTEVVVDFALGILRSGGYKRIKAMVRVFPAGDVVRCVRFTSLAKDLALRAERKTFEEEKRVFEKDLFREKRARSLLVGVPNIADMAVIRYRSRKAWRAIKERYVMARYSCDLLSVIGNRESDRALSCSLGVIAALKGMHERLLVHSDVKLENVLVLGSCGYLADFGLCRWELDLFSICGNLAYMAPETADGTCAASRKLDMFSFGMLLLAIAEMDWREGWFKTIKAMKGRREGFLEAYRGEHSKLLQALRRTLDPLHCLIADLLSFSPQNRPSAAETEMRLAVIAKRGGSL